MFVAYSIRVDGRLFSRGLKTEEDVYATYRHYRDLFGDRVTLFIEEV